MLLVTAATFKMADSDDEDTLTSFGTPLEPLEENAPRKKAVPIHEQIVTDTEGRRRFHGAFTGGFSAGYFNSVGTKQGWQPSTFVSSRSKKTDQRAQRPEDFMDDEDMGEFGIAPKRIATKEEFLSNERELQNRKRVVASEDSHGIIPGEPVLQDLVLPVNMSVGVTLLKKMGWKEGQGVGPRERRTKKKVYGCSLPPGLSSQTTTTDNSHEEEEEEEEDIFAVGLLFAPKDVDAFSFTPKDDKHGLGYKGLDPSTALFGRQDWLGIDPTSSRAGKKSITGEAFGVGAFEEDDDDIYAVDHMSKYDVELTAERSTGLHGWSGPQKENTRGGALSIFTATPKGMDVMKAYPPPVVPRDFNSTHTFPDSRVDPKPPSEEAHQKRKALTASDRREMLGEEPLPTPKKSVFEYISKEDKERVLSSSKDIAAKPSSATSSTAMNFASTASAQKGWSSKFWSGHSSFKPFAKDSAKQARYEEFLKMQRGEQVSQELSDSGLTEWEREREQEEFSRSAALYRPLNTTMAARFTTAKHSDDHRTVYEEVPACEPSDSSDQNKAASMKMFGKLTRDTFEWHPNKILCKRFNIPNPFPGSDVVGVPKVRRPKFTLGEFITPDKPRAITYDPSTSSGDDAQSGKLGKTSEAVGMRKALPKPSESTSVTSELNTKTSVDGQTSKFGETSKAVGMRKALPKPSQSTSLTSELNTNAFVEPLFTTTFVSPSTTAEIAGLPTSETEAQNNEGISPPKRPPMDLFKAIFADSSTDESEASDGDEDKEIEHLSTRVTENKTAEESNSRIAEEAAGSNGDAKADGSNVTDDVLSGHKALEKGLSGVKYNKDEQSPVETESLVMPSTEIVKPKSSPENYGPAPPPSCRNIEASCSFSGERRPKDMARSEEDWGDKRRVKKDKRKDSKKRYSDSSDSEEEYRSKHKHRHKDKKKHKHKHKSRSKHRDEERVQLSEQKNAEKDSSRKAEETVSVPDDKQILSKLKNLQNLKAGKRMRAIDFM